MGARARVAGVEGITRPAPADFRDKNVLNIVSARKLGKTASAGAGLPRFTLDRTKGRAPKQPVTRERQREPG